MTIPQEAIEAASRILSGEKEYYDTWDEARDILTAALPALEQQIRTKVADEIRAMYPEMSHQVLITERRYALYDGMREAARIAQGRE